MVAPAPELVLTNGWGPSYNPVLVDEIVLLDKAFNPFRTLFSQYL